MRPPSAALALLALAACGPSDSTPPSIDSTDPDDAATDVPINASINAMFDMEMDPETLTTTTFTVTAAGSAVAGTLILADDSATFWPTIHLATDTEHVATVTTGAQSANGVAMEEDYTWSFTTGDTVAPGLPVNLGAAGDFVILAKAAISNVPTSAITGDLGVSPAAATAITGLPLTADASNEFATTPQVTGKVYAADYTPPTPAAMTTSIGDMELAFTDAAGRAAGVTELGAGNIGGMTLSPGVYRWGTGLLVPTDLTLDGSATDVWIFQIAQDLTIDSGVQVELTGGALPENVFWQVAGLVDVGTTAHLEGIVLTQTSITLRTGASVNGRLLAQTAVSIDSSTIVEPAR